MQFKELNKSIKQNNKVKNFKQLSNILGIETNVSDTRAKKRALEKLALFYDFKKEGHKFVFDGDIFDIFYDLGKPLTRQEKSDYTSLIADSIVYNLSKLTDTDEIYGSTNFILLNLSLINKRFKYALKNIKLLSEETGVSEEVFEEFFRITKKKLDYDLKRALVDLSKRSLVSWDNVLIVLKERFNNEQLKKETVSIIATKDEERFYLHCSRNALDRLGINSTSDIYKSGVADQYYKYVDEELKRILSDEDLSFEFGVNNDIIGFYKGYRIVYNIDEIIDYRDKKISHDTLRKINGFKQKELAQNAESRVFDKLIKKDGSTDRGDFKYMYDIVSLINKFIADEDNKILNIDNDWEEKNDKIRTKIKNEILPEGLPTIDDIDYDMALKEWEGDLLMEEENE